MNYEHKGVRIMFFIMTCVAFRIAIFLIEDMVLKIDIHDINVAYLPRSTITTGMKIFRSIGAFAFVLTLAPWAGMHIAIILFKSKQNFAWVSLNFSYSVLACCWLCSMDAVIGLPAPLANVGHEGIPLLFLIALVLFVTAELMESWRLRREG